MAGRYSPFTQSAIPANNKVSVVSAIDAQTTVLGDILNAQLR